MINHQPSRTTKGGESGSHGPNLPYDDAKGSMGRAEENTSGQHQIPKYHLKVAILGAPE